MKETFILLISLSFSILGFSQEDLKWNWIAQSIGKDGQTSLNDVFIDDEGNTYATGTFESSFFEVGNLSADHPDRKGPFYMCGGGCYTTYTADAFVAKISSDGTPEWVQTIQGADSETGIAVTVNEHKQVLVLANTFGHEVDVDGVVHQLSKKNSFYEESFFVRLSSDGRLLEIFQLPGIGRGWGIWMKEDHEVLTLVGNFEVNNQGMVNLLGQSIETTFQYNAPLIVSVDAGSKKYIGHQHIGKVMSNSQAKQNIHEVIFHGNEIVVYAGFFGNVLYFGDERFNFLRGDHEKYYVARFTDDGDGLVESVFQHVSPKKGKISLNDSIILLAAATQSSSSYDKLFELQYYSYSSGSLINTYSEMNPQLKQVSFALNAVTIDKNQKVVLGASIAEKVQIGSEIYDVLPSVHVPQGHSTLTNQYSDAVILIVDDVKGVIHQEHLNGEFLEDKSLFLHTFENKVNYVASIQSEQVMIDDFKMNNTNEIRYYNFHDDPYGLFRYRNYLFSQFELTQKGTMSVKKMLSDQVSVYPNPTSGIVNIRASQEITSFEVFTTSGEKVLCGSGSQAWSFELARGTYLLRLISERNLVTKKLIVN